MRDWLCLLQGGGVDRSEIEKDSAAVESDIPEVQKRRSDCAKVQVEEVANTAVDSSACDSRATHRVTVSFIQVCHS